ncbi:hypothetical protein D9M72_384460 [compost metagenome]
MAAPWSTATAARSNCSAAIACALPAPTWPTPAAAPLPKTASTAGPRHVTRAKTRRRRRATCRAKCPATRRWTTMATGRKNPPTGRSGSRAPSAPAGHPTAPATGRGSRRGAGPGSTMPHGASPRRTTGAGPMWARAGAGCRVRVGGRATRRPWSPLSVAVAAAGTAGAACTWAAVPAWRGTRWVRAMPTGRRTAPAPAMSRASTASPSITS